MIPTGKKTYIKLTQLKAVQQIIASMLYTKQTMRYFQLPIIFTRKSNGHTSYSNDDYRQSQIEVAYGTEDAHVNLISN